VNALWGRRKAYGEFRWGNSWKQTSLKKGEHGRIILR
jgi:hypothetical protein